MSSTSDNSGGRRPLASRQWGISHALARKLAQWGIRANTVSVWSMIFGMAAGLSWASTSGVELQWQRALLWIGAAVFILLRLTANLLDGMVATEYGTPSKVGMLFNEIPDRVSDSAIFIGAGYAAGGRVELGYLAALLSVMTAYIRAVGKTAGAPQEFCGPMAKQQRMFFSICTLLYLACTPKTLHPQWNGWELTSGLLLFIILGSAATCLRRLNKTAQALNDG